MRTIIAALLLLMVAACKNEKKEKKQESVPVAKDSLQPVKSKDYYFVDSVSFLQKDVLLDTVYYMRKDSCVEISIIVPRKNQTNAVIYKEIADLKGKAMLEYRGVKKLKGQLCDDFHYQGIWIEPRHLYQTGKYISYVFRKGSGLTGNSAGFNHYAFNYDFERNRYIHLNDYFKLKTQEDSLSLGEIISRLMGEEVKFRKNEFERQFYFRKNFAFDNDNIYFFWDRYDIIGWGGLTSVIRKKVLLPYINPNYQ